MSAVHLDGRYRHPAVVAGITVLLLLLTGCGSSPSGKTSGQLLLRSCTSGGVSARCGTLLVREDRTANGGRAIPIRVVVIARSGPKRHSDPIVWFAGGPGDSAADMTARVRPLFGSNTGRDLVFIDQRGTAGSQLTCPAFPELPNRAALRAAVKSCLLQLNADLGSYTTAMSVDDVNEALSLMHYKKVNLVGISYGTTAEQTFLKRHPARVRTMTLLSGTLLSIPVFERFPRNAQLALDKIFAECAGEHSCHQAFPRLGADWTALWNSVTTHPWVVPASRSPDGKEAVFTAQWVASGLHRLMTVATTQSDIPLLIHILGSTSDRVAAILTIAKAMPQTQTSSANNMLRYSTRCNEQWASYDPNQLVGADSFEYAADLADARWWQYVCTFIPPAGPAADDSPPAKSEAPVLALNGAEDPQDPPQNMAGAHALWPNSLELTVPGQGHDIDNRSGACTARIMQSFIEQGSADRLDTTCLSALGPPSFALNLQALH